MKFTSATFFGIFSDSLLSLVRAANTSVTFFSLGVDQGDIHYRVLLLYLLDEFECVTHIAWLVNTRAGWVVFVGYDFHTDVGISVLNHGLHLPNVTLAPAV